MIPEGWHICELGDLVTFQRGHDLPREQMQKGIYPVAGSNGIIGFHNDFRAKGPGITIGRSGNIGTAYYYDTDYWAHNTTLYVKEFKDCSPKYIYYLLKTLDFTGHNSGSAVPTLNRNYIHPIKVLVPLEVSEQNKIASVLSSLDNKIELNIQMNKTLEALAQAIFKEWFIDFRFPGFDGELVEGLPIGWIKTSVGELGLYITDLVANGSFAIIKDNVKTYEDHGFALFMRNTDLKSGFSKKVFVDEHSYNFLKKSALFGGELILSNVGDIGSVHLCPSKDIPMTLGNNCIMVRSELYEKWLYLFFKSELGQHKLKGAVIGSVQEKLSKTNFKRIELNIPPKIVLKEFNNIAIPILHRIESNIKMNEILGKIRDTLLPKLITGKIRFS